jgi:ferric-dicitrate binding protein FerR (iron transport regulator)
MDYSDFSENEFALDESFQQWVLNPQDSQLDAFWQGWVQQHPHKRETIEQARQMIGKIRFDAYHLTDLEVAQIWNQIQNNQHSGDQSPRSDQSPSQSGLAATKKRPLAGAKKGKLQAYYRIAALLVALATVSVLTIYLLNARVTYASAYGEIRTLNLPDESVVKLNANSTLTLSSEWTPDQDRHVWLDGEAYFSVVHTRNHQKFIVHLSDGSFVEVVGTEFNVSKRRGKTQVVLARGKVKFNTGDRDTIVMKPGELVLMQGKSVTRQNVSSEQYTAWTRQLMILDHTSLLQITQLLEDNYGLNVIVSQPELLEQTISGSLPVGQLNALLDRIGKTFGLNLVRKGNQVYISEKLGDSEKTIQSEKNSQTE